MRPTVYLFTKRMYYAYVLSPQPLVKSGKPEPVEAIGWSDLTCTSESERNRRNGNVHPSLSQKHGGMLLRNITPQKLCLGMIEKC